MCPKINHNVEKSKYKEGTCYMSVNNFKKQRLIVPTYRFTWHMFYLFLPLFSTLI